MSNDDLLMEWREQKHRLATLEPALITAVDLLIEWFDDEPRPRRDPQAPRCHPRLPAQHTHRNPVPHRPAPVRRSSRQCKALLMPRTLEQAQADEALTAAIDQARKAYWPDSAPRILTDYVVVRAEQTYDDDGDSEVAYGTLVRDGDQASHRTLGLLQQSMNRHKAFAIAAVLGDDE